MKKESLAITTIYPYSWPDLISLKSFTFMEWIYKEKGKEFIKISHFYFQPTSIPYLFVGKLVFLVTWS